MAPAKSRPAPRAFCCISCSRTEKVCLVLEGKMRCRLFSSSWEQRYVGMHRSNPLWCHSGVRLLKPCQLQRRPGAGRWGARRRRDAALRARTLLIPRLPGGSFIYWSPSAFLPGVLQHTPLDREASMTARAQCLAIPLSAHSTLQEKSALNDSKWIRRKLSKE